MKKAIKIVVFSILFALVNTTYFSMEEYPFFSTLEISSFFKYSFSLIFFVAIGILAGCILELILTAISKRRNSPLVYKYDDKKSFFVIFLVHLISYIIVLFALYPGVFHYDVYTQIDMVMNSAYSNHHPLLHTLYMGLFYKLGLKIGNINLGIFFANFIQLLLVSLSFSYFHIFVKRLGLGRIFRYTSIVFTAFMPVFTILSVSTTKDVLFSAVFLYFLTLLAYRYVDNSYFNKASICVFFALAVIGTVMLRNNGLYIVCFTLLIFVLEAIKGRKHAVKDIIVCFGAIIVSLLLINVLKVSLKANSANISEALSMPVQQLGYVYNNEELNKSDKKEIKNYISTIKKYDPYKSDILKEGLTINGDSKGFISTWFSFGLKYPKDYIVAAMKTNQGYFYILDKSCSYIYVNLPGFLRTGVKKGYGVERHSYIPILEAEMVRLFSDNEYFDNPLLRFICQPSLYMWVFIFCFLNSLFTKNGRAIKMLLMIGVYVGTLILGPCVLVRYALPYMMAIILLLIISTEKE